MAMNSHWANENGEKVETTMTLNSRLQSYCCDRKERTQLDRGI